MLKLQLLGSVRVDAPHASPEARGTRRRALALLAYVAAAAPQTVNREKIMALLWPESDAERASNSLRQTLFWIRRDLHEDLIVVDKAGGLQLNPALIEVDVWSFREGVAQEQYEVAIAAYSGAFMDGFQIADAPDYLHWLEAERLRLERQHLHALDELAQQASNEGRFGEAVAWRRQQAAADPFNSRVALSLLRELVAAGNRPGALEYASIYQNLLKLHLDAEPDPAVSEYVSALRAQKPSRTTTQPAKSQFEFEQPAVSASAESVARSATPRRRKWLSVVGAGVLVFGTGLAAYGLGKRAAFADTIELGTGMQIVDGHDRDTRMIACTGAACPSGRLPQNAFVVPKHPYYTAPATGTAFIAPVPDGTTTKVGYGCCTTAVFEQDFKLPKNAVSATILVSVLADNQASVAVNGEPFGQQSDRDNPDNYGGAPAVFSTTFPPDPSGNNRLLVTLWDGKGALGLNYHATITYKTAQNDR